jgi:hypothetical protein
MGSGDNYTTDNSQCINGANVEAAYRSSNNVNYIRQMFKHYDGCTSLDYVEKKLPYLALEGWFDSDSAQVFNLLPTTTKWRSTRQAHQLPLQTIQDEPFLHPVSQQECHWRDTHVHGVCRSIKLTSPTDASKVFGIPNFVLLFWVQIEQDWGFKVSGLMLGYDQNVLIDSIFIKLQNGLRYYHSAFHNLTSVERLGLDCNVEFTNANHGIMPEVHNIWVQSTQSEENDLDNTFQG